MDNFYLPRMGSSGYVLVQVGLEYSKYWYFHVKQTGQLQILIEANEKKLINSGFKLSTLYYKDKKIVNIKFLTE